MPVLADLGIDAEHCGSAVDAVEKVSTLLFQIVITDWDDQPEAGALLKAARGLRAAHRPLTLAIVSDNAKVPEALQAGANSVLLKPIRAQQARDTMSTACALLRAKQTPAAAKAAGSGSTAVAGAAPKISAKPDVGSGVQPFRSALSPSAVPPPMKEFRPVEFLSTSEPSPSAQFVTESEIPSSGEETPADEVSALNNLEPTAAAVRNAATSARSQEAVSGWASLQTRLTNSPARTGEARQQASELLSYGDISQGQPPPLAETVAPSPLSLKASVQAAKEMDAAADARPDELSDELPDEPIERSHRNEPAPHRRGKLIWSVALLAACGALAAIPQTRLRLRSYYQSAVGAGRHWLNPQPAPLPQVATQHDSFGQSGDEYKLPAAGNIPDATTDPTQIQVLPVVDPTAKPPKGTDATQATTDPSQNSPENSPSDQGQTNQNPQGPNPGASVGPPVNQTPIDNPATSNPANTPRNSTPAPAPSTVSPQTGRNMVQPTPPPHAPVVRNITQSHGVSVVSSSAIPSSLRSQLASMTPDSSGAKPVEAAMSSIEPVNLTEAAARELLVQPVTPEYPARANGQKGNVVLQVLIGRDGTVQDAKFLQGSLLFAKPAIDATRQWKFKPYSMNGRPVSVQSLITLSFRPPA